MFRIVLVEPEIPPNTGNVIRLCANTGARLHLVRPLGFPIDHAKMRRAGLDYWPRLDVTHHDSADAWLASLGDRAPWLFTTKGTRDVYDVQFRRGDTLVFGRETRGLDPALLARFPDRLVRFPMLEGERSLNLATAVCAAVYEGLRQAIAGGDVRTQAGLLRL